MHPGQRVSSPRIPKHPLGPIMNTGFQDIERRLSHPAGVSVGAYFARNVGWFHLHRITRVAVYISTDVLVPHAFVAFTVNFPSLSGPVQLLLERKAQPGHVKAEGPGRAEPLDQPALNDTSPIIPLGVMQGTQDFEDQFTTPPPDLQGESSYEMLCRFTPASEMNLFDVALLAYLARSRNATSSARDHTLLYARLIYTVLHAHFGASTAANEEEVPECGAKLGGNATRGQDETFEQSHIYLLVALKEKIGLEMQEVLDEIQAAVLSDEIDRELASIEESIRILKSGFLDI
ncbi:hypothetical protein BKA70DRAFT_1262907 [Coprinopsis sp. MPI-PUGE-AT-0042]|nr:hypothetical protein BKA70DRAFT_1262907 [Coprinopsis sp. MPI-PUGE-AT-0042]